MDRARLDRALVSYARSEGDEGDIIRLCQIALARGVLLTPLEALVIWQWWSETRYAAGWMDLDDDGAGRALAVFLAAFGGAAQEGEDG